MTKFDYDNIVTAIKGSDPKLRPGEKGWVCGIYEIKTCSDEFKNKYCDGNVYLIEFEDGDAVKVHESQLILIDRNL